ncbi:sugar ABC transporter permease [Candidatus Bipolaricaulota bacterium]|nr:sugar ABC transporter permease [Candidatus Bipolaricaulota bacterium]
MKRKSKGVFALLIPALIIWFIFMLGPALWGIYVSFTNEALTGPAAAHPRFVGLQNYKRLFRDPLFYGSVYRSFIFVAGSAIIGQAGLGLLLAALTSQRRRLWPKIRFAGRLATTLAWLAWVVPETVIGWCWISFLDYDGVLNEFLRFLGFKPVYWLVHYGMLSIILANIWWGTGWSVMLFKAALESIPREIEEAAEVDGAAGWKKFRYITLPLLRGPVMVNLILITIWTYGVFGLPLMLTGGGPGHRTELMTIYAYKLGFKYFEIGYGTTVSIGILLISLLLTLGYYKLLGRRG